jgi:hypothetical protein
MIDEDKIARRYAGIGLMLIIVLWLMSILVATLRPEWQLMSPIWVSTGFSLFFLLGFAVLWRWVVRKHKDSVTTLYSVVSGFRMLMALFTLFIVFLVVGRAAMLPYVLVFMIFYLVMVAYHSIYFSRITNRQ